jgi:UDP-glucose 4-epimerase
MSNGNGDIRGRRVIVTGGAGFIGSELVHQLVAGGAYVTIIDNLVNGKREHLQGTLGGNGRLVVDDIRNLDTVGPLLYEVEVLYHLACLGVRHSIHSPMENHSVNAEATLAMLNLAKARNINRFVHVSTSEVYGNARTTPMDEAHPTNPTTVYGASKLAGEAYARAFHDTYDLDTVVVRPFNAYGPRSHHEGDSGEVIPKLMLRAMAGRPLLVFGDGKQTRDFSYVSDTARSIMAAGFRSGVVGRTINIGSGRETSVNELVREIVQVTKRNDISVLHQPERPGDILRLCADSARAVELLDHQASVDLPAGLAALHEWYREMKVEPAKLLEAELDRNWETAD